MNNQQGHPLQPLASFPYFLIAGWAMTVSLPMRRFSGKHYLKTTAAMGVMIILCYTVLVPAPDLAVLLPVFLYAIVIHLAGQVRMRMKGVIQHTRYDGDPWFTRLIFFCKDERRCKGVCEPFVAFALGFYLLPQHGACGAYFLIAGIAMVMVQLQIEKQFEHRIDTMNDGRIENESVMEAYQRQFQKQRRR